MEIIADIVERIRALRTSLDEAFELAGPIPADETAFDAMGKIERVASTAAIKVVEQLEDQLARLFRSILQVLLVDTDGWFAQDVANRMEQLGIVADANAWVSVIKLRNRLVHDYPITRAAQLARLKEAHDASTILHDSADRAVAFLKHRGLL